MEVDGVSRWGAFRNLGQAEADPGVDLSQAELTAQLQGVHGPEETVCFQFSQASLISLFIKHFLLRVLYLAFHKAQQQTQFTPSSTLSFSQQCFVQFCFRFCPSPCINLLVSNLTYVGLILSNTESTVLVIQLDFSMT